VDPRVAVYGLGRLTFGAALLDTAAQAADWQHLPADRRAGGVAAAVASAAVGLALLART
jgi:hypothetical protein